MVKRGEGTVVICTGKAKFRSVYAKYCGARETQGFDLRRQEGERIVKQMHGVE